MSEVNARRAQFTELASRLVSTSIAPRLEVLASYFPNAVRAKDEPADHCSYWFGYSERFPASTKLSFGVEHDVRFERAALFYAVSMSPLFLKLNERDKLVMTLGAVNEQEVVDWLRPGSSIFSMPICRSTVGEESLKMNRSLTLSAACGLVEAQPPPPANIWGIHISSARRTAQINLPRIRKCLSMSDWPDCLKYSLL
jgi:hypothetical protein